MILSTGLSKAKKLILLATTLLIAQSMIIFGTTQTAEAAFGRLNHRGYFTNTLDYYGGFVFINGLQTGDVNSFVGTIRARLGAGGRERTGAAFIILTMLGYNGGTPKGQADAEVNRWDSLVRAYAAAGRVNFNQSVYYPPGFVNSFYQGTGSGVNPDDDAFYNDSSGQTQDSIVFYNPDGSQFKIKKNCGNVAGDMSPLQNLPPPTTTIQGRVFNINTFAGYSGVTIETCQGQVGTDGSGSFYKTANVGSGFCIRAVGGLPAGSSVFIRPWSEGYPGQSPGCPGFSGDTSSPLVNGKNYCAQQSYECQIAGQHNFGFCGLNVDRSWDGGYDLAVIPPSSFTITPNVSPPVLSPDSESPTSAEFVSGFGVDINPGPGNGVRANITRSYFIRYRNGSTAAISSPADDNNGTNPWPEGTKTYGAETRDLTSYNLKVGDQVCSSLQANPGSGTVDNNGAVVNSNGPTQLPPQCQAVANKPYLSVFGGGVWAGSKFNTSPSACTSYEGGEIRTYARFNSGRSFGSAAQYVAQAMNAIVGNTADKGFYSGSQRTPPSATSPGYLTIANNGWAPPNWGGNMGGGRCLADFYDENAKITRFSTNLPAISGSVDINSLGDNQQYFSAGNLTLTALGPTSKRVTIYVNGDVSLPSDIAYAGVYSASDLDSPDDPSDADQIPYVTIIARGNIYVSRGVNILSGLYIAQPDTAGNKGEIFTCANGFSIVDIVNRFYECNGPEGIDPLSAICNGGSGSERTGSPLAVYGAFIARKVHLDRSNGTLRCASPYPEPFTWDKMAEKFYMTPELYLGQPVFRSQSSEDYSGFGGAQSYSNLPPIF